MKSTAEKIIDKVIYGDAYDEHEVREGNPETEEILEQARLDEEKEKGYGSDYEERLRSENPEQA